MFNLATLTIVVPCFNEEEMLSISIPKFLLILEDLICKKLIDDNSKLLFIDDGSKDKTWEIILNYHQYNFKVKGIKGEFKHEVRQFQKPYDNQQAEQISLMV